MRHKVLSRRISWAVGALLLAGLAATVGVGDTKAFPGDKDKSNDKGYIGVYMQDLSRDVRRGLDLDVKKGVLISGVVEDSPAAQAGIEDGDVVVSFDGKKVSDSDDLADLVRDAEPGSKVKVELIRDGKTKTVELTLGERPERFGDEYDWNFNFDDLGDFDVYMDDLGDHMRDIGHTVSLHLGPRLGIHTHELNEGLADYFDTDDGVLVLDVEDESVAQEAGIKPGDVVKKVGDEQIKDTNDIREALRDLDDGDQVDVTVLRKGKTETLKATMTEQSLNAFRRAPRVMRRHIDAPRVHVERFDERSMRKELDELKQELKELKRELKKGQDG